MKKFSFNKKTLKKNLIILGKIILLILIATIPALTVFAYLDVQKEREKAFLLGEVDKLKEQVKKLEITPTATPSPIPTLKAESAQTGTQTKYSFTNRQYEASVSNINYTDRSGGGEKTIGTGEHTVKLRQITQNPFFEFDLILKNISIAPFIIGYSISSCEVLKDVKLTNFSASENHTLEKGLLPNELKQDRLKMDVSGTDYDASGNKITPSGNLKLKSCKIMPLMSESSIEPKTIQFPN